MGRWYISTQINHSPLLQRYYQFSWGLIGNLGLDLIVPPIAAVIGIELASKIGVILIPVLTVSGLIWLAKQVHGRVPPSAFFALPLAYAWPFQLGFVNFELAQALALWALGLWIRLGKAEKIRSRRALFIPISFVLWIAHDFGWGLFGLMAFSAECARLVSKQNSWTSSVTGAATECILLALPALYMMLEPNQTVRGNSTGDWFDFQAKLIWLMSLFRDRWGPLDKMSLVPVLMTLYVGSRSRRMGLAPILAWPALVCVLSFLFLPRLLLGGSFVDMRVLPVTLMLALVAIRPPSPPGRLGTLLAASSIAFFALRAVASTLSFIDYDRVQQDNLKALDALPMGTTVLVLATRACKTDWTDDRLTHLAGIAIIRRQAFVNEQWTLEGQQLLRIRYNRAAPFTADPSQQIFRDLCTDQGPRLAPAIASFNRNAFAYVWTLGFGPGLAKASDLKLIWTNGRSALYRVIR